MIIKNLFTMKRFILLPLFTFGQVELGCDFTPPDYFFDSLKFSATVKTNFLTDDPIVMNVFFHVLNPTNGVNPDGLTENDLLAQIAKLNIAFNPYMIFYKYRGYAELNDDYYYYDATFNEVMNAIHNTAEYSENNINVIIFDQLYAAAASFATQEVATTAFATVDNSYVILEHEFGHLAGLLHTFEGTDISDCNPYTGGSDCTINISNNCDINPTYLTQPDFYEVGQSGYDMEENVTRDVNSQYYNADTKGDLVTDTHAAFRGSENNFCLNNGDSTPHYVSQSDIFDNSSTNEMYVDIDLLNHMSYYSNKKREHFTNGQGVRMRETLLDPTNTQISQRMTTVESLYEPYLMEWVEYSGGGGDDNITLSSGLTFERQNVPTGYYLSHFQPGFDYEIYNCMVFSDGTSQTYDLAFTYEYSITEIPVFNQQGHQIKILQVGDDLSECQPFWLSPNVVGGSIYMQNENTYQELDSLNINNSYFFDDLPNGVHTINIHTNTNETIQKTFLKDNE